MSGPTPHWFLRAPDHLGDGVLTLPLAEAMAQRARLTVAAPAWGPHLFGHLGTVVPRGSVPVQASVAVLAKPAFRAAWEARSIPRRIGWPTDHRRLGLTDVVRQTHAHRLDDLAALGGPLDLTVSGLPTLPTTPAGQPGIVLLPSSASGPPVEWPHYRELADALALRGHPVRFAAGPGESARLARVAGPHPMLPELSVTAIARVFAAADAVVGNDSGLTHLAAAARRGAGRSVAAVVGIVGSTDPARTGAPGATWCVGPRVSCAPCYAKRCHRALGCLDLPVHAVLQAVLDVIEAAP